MHHSLDDSAALLSIADELHGAAAEIPISTSTGYGLGLAEDLEDQIRRLGLLLASFANTMAVHSRAPRAHGGPSAGTHRRVVMEAHAAGAVGTALADLAEAMVQVAILQDGASVNRPAGRAGTVQSAHATLDRLFNSARRRLHHAARQLHHNADHLYRPMAPATSTEPRMPPRLPTSAPGKRSNNR
ncbi:hypothetical protein G3I43_33215 [Streptomyces anulatus]|uniref:Uncharacterized protein n=1 Tax=Streptomyces anulatus TaxID=1892 RepID=A0A6G3T1E3_STRAQ|nr:hypothetical protein [Streptomyces anulatus]NEB88989.1 hypothetical protein [Streptomyces anulatus]